MDAVGLLALAVCGASLLTVFAPRRSLDRDALSTDGRPAASLKSAMALSVTAAGSVRCPYCGSENDAHPSVTFCRRCLGRLTE
jgi:hypothetical protein